eukprot:16446615-Heterocapsa_arctica.AAC.1
MAFHPCSHDWHSRSQYSPWGGYYNSSPANSVDSSEEESLPAYLRGCRPDEAGLFLGPDIAINGDKLSSNTSTRFASPASSIADDECSD